MFFVFTIPAALTIAAILTLAGIPVVLVVIVYFTYRTHLRVKEKGQIRSEAIIREIENLGEKVLGCIRVERLSPGILNKRFFQEVLVFTPKKVFVERIAEIEPGEHGPDVDYVSEAEEIPISEVTKVELNKFGKAFRLRIVTSEKDYKWYAHGFIPEKKDVKLEDYENILRSVFPDRLSVKTGFFPPIF